MARGGRRVCISTLRGRASGTPARNAFRPQRTAYTTLEVLMSPPRDDITTRGVHCTRFSNQPQRVPLLRDTSEIITYCGR